MTNGTRQLEATSTVSPVTCVATPAAPLLAAITQTRSSLSDLAPEILFDDQPLSYMRLVGDSHVDKTPVRLYRYDDPGYRNGTREQRLYVAADTGLPARYQVFFHDRSGKSTELSRADFSDWELGIDLPTSTFDATPPPGARGEPGLPSPFDPRNTPGRWPAPLKATDTAGRAVSLDAYRGKVLLLQFWLSSAQLCRDDLQWVRHVYARRHRQGFDVIAVCLDGADRRSAVRRYLQRSRFPWRQIVEGKGFDGQTAIRYGVKDLPLSLLIGRSGRIVAIDASGAELDSAVARALSKRTKAW